MDTNFINIIKKENALRMSLKFQHIIPKPAMVGNLKTDPDTTLGWSQNVHM